MTYVVEGLDKTRKTTMQTWLNLVYTPYNARCDLIAAVKTPHPFVVPSWREPMLPFPERSGPLRPPPPVRDVQDVLVHLVTITEGALPENHAYLPLHLPNAEFFALLPHLVSPHYKTADTRAAAMLALMVYRNEDRASQLSLKAAAHLTEIQGTWLPKDPWIVSGAFIAFIRGAPFLTDAETRFYEIFGQLSHVHAILDTNVRITTAWGPSRGDYLETNLDVCDRCNIMDSVTTMCNGVCISCQVPSLIPETSPSGTRFMTKCRTCDGMYAIARPSRLSCRPKCHWCRNEASREPRHLYGMQAHHHQARQERQ